MKNHLLLNRLIFLSDKFKNCKVGYLKCKTWSGNTFIQDWEHAIKYTLNYENYLADTKSCNVSELTILPHNINKKYTYFNKRSSSNFNKFK